MDMLVSLLCSCVKQVMEDADGDGVPDIMQKSSIFDPDGDRKPQGDSLNDALLRNLLSIRGRKNVIRDIPIDILPTKFEDEDDLASLDEDGEEIPVLKEGIFAGQQYEHIKQRSFIMIHCNFL